MGAFVTNNGSSDGSHSISSYPRDSAHLDTTQKLETPFPTGLVIGAISLCWLNQIFSRHACIVQEEIIYQCMSSSNSYYLNVFLFRISMLYIRNLHQVSSMKKPLRHVMDEMLWVQFIWSNSLKPPSLTIWPWPLRLLAVSSVMQPSSRLWTGSGSWKGREVTAWE